MLRHRDWVHVLEQVLVREPILELGLAVVREPGLVAVKTLVQELDRVRVTIPAESQEVVLVMVNVLLLTRAKCLRIE
ncbi:hypothetical protein HA402_001558 [Bradysia odoriphaga]|nr:hypothetical protein HA402_001558 [Bradysia odoriphaga]